MYFLHERHSKTARQIQRRHPGPTKAKMSPLNWEAQDASLEELSIYYEGLLFGPTAAFYQN